MISLSPLRIKSKFIIFALLTVPFLWFQGARADTLFQNQKFSVNSTFDKDGRSNLTATLHQISDRAYFYVEDEYWNNLNSLGRNRIINNINQLANAFDNNIYPKETSFWGPEPNPGIDGDSRITILFEDLKKGNGGYFDTSNGFRKEQAEQSNEREMIALNADAALSDVSLVKDFLAHELQHLISFNQGELKYGQAEEVWLNELRSEYSVSVAGYNDDFNGSNLERRVELFRDNPSDSLTEWPNDNKDYAIVAIFAEYLTEKYGPVILSETLNDSALGIPSINKFLRERGYDERFEDIFINWMMAVYYNNISFNDKFGYARSELNNLKITPQYRISLSDSLDRYGLVYSLKDWQPAWFEFNLPALADDKLKSLKISVNPSRVGESFLVSYASFYNDGSINLNTAKVNSSGFSAYAINSEKGLNRVAVLATKATKINNFNADEIAQNLSVNVEIINTTKAEANTLKDGALIKKSNEKEVYVIWGKYKRYLRPEVISLYGHLNASNVIEVDITTFNSYTTSNYVKYVNDEKVYAVWPEGTKHWLNMTGEYFTRSNRDWGAIFVINDLELNVYSTGADIIR